MSKPVKQMSYTALKECLRHANREAENYLQAAHRAEDAAAAIEKRLAQAESARDWLGRMLAIVSQALEDAQIKMHGPTKTTDR